MVFEDRHCFRYGMHHDPLECVHKDSQWVYFGKNGNIKQVRSKKKRDAERRTMYQRRVGKRQVYNVEDNY